MSGSICSWCSDNAPSHHYLELHTVGGGGVCWEGQRAVIVQYSRSRGILNQIDKNTAWGWCPQTAKKAGGCAIAVQKSRYMSAATAAGAGEYAVAVPKRGFLGLGGTPRHLSLPHAH